jgi:hypothetical protein
MPQARAAKPSIWLRAVVASSFLQASRLKHDPEKWVPVFGKDHAQTTTKAKGRFNLKPFRFSVA